MPIAEMQASGGFTVQLVYKTVSIWEKKVFSGKLPVSI
jgi:hypothetical protein